MGGGREGGQQCAECFVCVISGEGGTLLPIVEMRKARQDTANGHQTRAIHGPGKFPEQLLRAAFALPRFYFSNKNLKKKK